MIINDRPGPHTFYRDRTDRPNPKDLILEDLEGGMAVKLPGSLKGSSYVVQNCRSSQIYVLDHTGAVNVDDCEDCDIVLGPVKGRCVCVWLLNIFQYCLCVTVF